MKNEYKTVELKQGSIIQGTNRPEDLLGVFLFALEDLAPGKAYPFAAELIDLGFGYSQRNVCGMGNREDWPKGFGDKEAYEIIDSMADCLTHIAPKGYYFGARVNDGSDFGFWPYSDLKE